jgi:hypothetical protein
MSKILLSLILGLLFLTTPISKAFASDWDTVGKALTGITGLRIISGGNIDIVGNITGTNMPRNHARAVARKPRKIYPSANERAISPKATAWKKGWVSTHTIYTHSPAVVVIEERNWRRQTAYPSSQWIYAHPQKRAPVYCRRH